MAWPRDACRLIAAAGLAAGLALPAPAWSTPVEDAYVVQFVAADQAHRRFTPVTEMDPTITPARAYDLQHRLVAAKIGHGDAIAGFKGGLMSAKSLQQKGADRILVAPLFRSGMKTSPARIDRAVLVNPAYEIKIAYVFGQPVTAPLKSVAELKAKVKAMRPALDLPDIAYRDPDTYNARDMIAAYVSSANVVFGPPVDPASVDPNAVHAALYRDGKLVAEGLGKESLEDQWGSLLTLVNIALEQGYAIAPDQVIITGKIGEKGVLTPGAYRAHYDGLGELSFTVTP